MEYMETIKSPILVLQCKASYSCIFIKVKYAKTTKHGVETPLVLAFHFHDEFWLLRLLRAVCTTVGNLYHQKESSTS